MGTKRRYLHRWAVRLLYVLFVLLILVPPELPLLLPAPVAAAVVDSDSVASLQVDTSQEVRGDTPLVASDPAAGASDAPIEAGKATALSPSANVGADLLPAFMQTLDLGDGERAALISSDPVRYLTPNGEWQAIDPRFTQSLDGFSNLTNVMQVRTGARQAVLQVSHGTLDARWTPHALLLADGGREVVLAKPRPAQAVAGELAPGGRSVHYAASWSIAGMDDEIVAGAGEAEHNVIFAQAPLIEGVTPGSEARLVLRATLELPPGGQLWVDGVQQTASFVTTGTIELRDHEGTTTLNLAPALIFEKDQPDQSLVATYHVTPTDARAWQVSMETPLAWWVDPARQYPVVWDPLMQVLRALETAQIYSNPACANFVLNDLPGTTGLGRATCDIGGARHYSPVRTLLRFTKMGELNLPPGAQIQGGILLVAPYYGYINYTSYGQFDPCVNAQLHRVTAPWAPNSVNWGNQPAVDPNPFVSNSTSYSGRTDPPICYSSFSSRHSGTKYLLQNGPTGIVTDWINGGTNFGLLLRGTAAEENGCDYRYGCDYVQIARRSTWERRATRNNSLAMILRAWPEAASCSSCAIRGQHWSITRRINMTAPRRSPRSMRITTSIARATTIHCPRLRAQTRNGWPLAVRGSVKRLAFLAP
jgi:hypothetical protein